MEESCVLERTPHQKRNFLVHFFAHGQFQLDQFLDTLNERHPLRVVSTSKSDVVSVEICITEKELRLLISILPEKKVSVSYEDL